MRDSTHKLSLISAGLTKLDLLQWIEWLDNDGPSLKENLPGVDLNRSYLNVALCSDLSEIDTINLWCEQFLKRKGTSLNNNSATIAPNLSDTDGAVQLYRARPMPQSMV